MEDKKISDAVELLLKGAKMLAYHCPECSMPLFLHDGKVICPSCKKEAEIIEKGKNVEVRLKEEHVKEEEMEKRKVIKPKIEKEEDLEELLKNVLRIYIEKLVDDYDSAEKTIRVINSLLEIIETIRRLNI